MACVSRPTLSTRCWAQHVHRDIGHPWRALRQVTSRSLSGRASGCLFHFVEVMFAGFSTVKFWFPCCHSSFERRSFDGKYPIPHPAFPHLFEHPSCIFLTPPFPSHLLGLLLLGEFSLLPCLCLHHCASRVIFLHRMELITVTALMFSVSQIWPEAVPFSWLLCPFNLLWLYSEYFLTLGVKWSRLSHSCSIQETSLGPWVYSWWLGCGTSRPLGLQGLKAARLGEWQGPEAGLVSPACQGSYSESWVTGWGTQAGPTTPGISLQTS